MKFFTRPHIINIGAKASVLLFEKLNIASGKYMLQGCENTNRKRLYHYNYKSEKPKMKRRKILRGIKKAKDDKIEKREGTVYKAGGF